MYSDIIAKNLTMPTSERGEQITEGFNPSVKLVC